MADETEPQLTEGINRTGLAEADPKLVGEHQSTALKPGDIIADRFKIEQ